LKGNVQIPEGIGARHLETSPDWWRNTFEAYLELQYVVVSFFQSFPADSISFVSLPFYDRLLLMLGVYILPQSILEKH